MVSAPILPLQSALRRPVSNLDATTYMGSSSVNITRDLVPTMRRAVLHYWQTQHSITEVEDTLSWWSHLPVAHQLHLQQDQAGLHSTIQVPGHTGHSADIPAAGTQSMTARDLTEGMWDRVQHWVSIPVGGHKLRKVHT